MCFSWNKRKRSSQTGSSFRRMLGNYNPGSLRRLSCTPGQQPPPSGHHTTQVPVGWARLHQSFNLMEAGMAWKMMEFLRWNYCEWCPTGRLGRLRTAIATKLQSCNTLYSLGTYTRKKNLQRKRPWRHWWMKERRGRQEPASSWVVVVFGAGRQNNRSPDSTAERTGSWRIKPCF